MTEYTKKTAEDLTKLIDEKREAIRAFRFDVSGSTKKNVKASGTARKEVARILTELSIRLSAATSAQAGKNTANAVTA